MYNPATYCVHKWFYVETTREQNEGWGLKRERKIYKNWKWGGERVVEGKRESGGIWENNRTDLQTIE